MEKRKVNNIQHIRDEQFHKLKILAALRNEALPRTTEMIIDEYFNNMFKDDGWKQKIVRK